MKLYLAPLFVVGALALPNSPSVRQESLTIVGGLEASQGQLPYQLSYQKTSFIPNLHYCGATIYDETTAITAAQCVYKENYDHPFHLQVVAGELSLSADSGLEQRRNVTKIIIHPDFMPPLYFLKNDIAILKFSEPFVFNENVSPLSLAKPGVDFTGDSCVVSGWGALTNLGEPSDVLRFIDVPVITDEQCDASYKFIDLDCNICAGETGKYTCQNDYGGPLVCDGALVGIISYDHFCGKGDLPGFYTRVSNYYDWILANI